MYAHFVEQGIWHDVRSIESHHFSMNYLAHLFLSNHHPDILVGNMMTDMMHKREEAEVIDSVKSGIALHRDIDRLTDTHPIFIQHKRMLYPDFGKYSPVVLDIIYDYFLENNWTYFSQESYGYFEEKTYQILIAHLHKFPERISPVIQRMVQAKWLQQYVTIEGLQGVFNRLERKISFPQSFAAVGEIVLDRENVWGQEHLLFFQDILNQLHELGWSIPQNVVK